MEFRNKTEFIDANLSYFHSFNLQKKETPLKEVQTKCMQIQDCIDQEVWNKRKVNEENHKK